MQSWQVRVQGWCGQGWNTGVFYGVTATSYSYWRTAEGSDWYDKQSEKKIVYSFYISVENLSEIFIYL